MMLKPYQETWQELERTALHFLKEPELFDGAVVHKGLVRTLRAWCYPSFKQYVSWHLLMARTGSSTLPGAVIKVAWDRRSDCERFFNPLAGVKHEYKFTSRPSIKTLSGAIDSDRIRILLEDASRLTVSLSVEEGGVTIDGSLFGIELSASGAKCAFEWNNQARPWADLTKLVDRVSAIVETTLTDQQAT